MVANALAYYVLDKSTRNHVNTDVNENEDSQSFETPRKNNRSYTYFGDTIITTTTTNVSKLTPPGKWYLCFQITGKTVWAAQCANQEH